MLIGHALRHRSSPLRPAPAPQIGTPAAMPSVDAIQCLLVIAIRGL
ncbi:MAG: hypothetical protein HYU75_03010 [Betaproteobacteria bacterium]|nr:hypothetical protein [Betaproteobacteria bacterium]